MSRQKNFKQKLGLLKRAGIPNGNPSWFFRKKPHGDTEIPMQFELPPYPPERRWQMSCKCICHKLKLKGHRCFLYSVQHGKPKKGGTR